jgi:TolA-binding protein
LTPLARVGYIPAASQHALVAAVRANVSRGHCAHEHRSVRSGTIRVGKEKSTASHSAATDAPTAPAGFLARLLPTARGKLIVIGSLSATIIGTIAALALIYQPSKQLAPAQKLAQAYSDLEKGKRVAARQLAAQVLAESANNYTEHGGAYFILGTVTLQDASEQSNAEKRQMLNVVASRYLEEAHSRGVPAAQQRELLLMLGRALHDAARYSRSISILRDALHECPEEATSIHALLADCYLGLEPPNLAEALDHNRQYLAATALSEQEQDAGRLLSGRILLVQKNLSEAEATIRSISEQSPRYPEAVILQGQVLLAAMASPQGAPEGVTAAAALLEELRKLLARENLSPNVAAQAQLLIGRLLEEQGDARAAASQYENVRRNFFGQPEAFAAAIFLADLIRADNPRDAVALYKRVLAQLASADVHYNNTWLPAEEFRTRLSSAIDDLATRGLFAEAVDLAESLVAPVSPQVTVERQANIHRAWARQLEDRAKKELLPHRPVTQAEARQHWRQAGALWHKFAALDAASRQYLDHLTKSAEDFRRGQGYEQAAVVYRELLDQESQNGEPEALVGLGESLLALGQIEEALTVLATCRDAYPRHPVSYRARLLAGVALIEKGQLTTAQELFTDNLYGYSLAPQSVDWRDSLFALGGLVYRQALELESKSRVAGVDRIVGEGRREGLALLEQAHSAFEDAIRTLTEATERYPEAPQVTEARYRIAEAHRHAAKLPRKRLLNVTIQTSAAALHRQMQEELQAAVDGYNVLITKLSERDGSQHLPLEAAILRNCYFSRADALFDMAKYEDAIQAYSAATNRYQHEPESLEAYIQISSCYRRLGRASEARRTLEQARVVLQRIRPDADFAKTTRLARQDWGQLLDWLRTL